MQTRLVALLLLGAAAVASAANLPSAAIAVARNRDLVELQAKLKLVRCWPHCTTLAARDLCCTNMAVSCAACAQRRCDCASPGMGPPFGP